MWSCAVNSVLNIGFFIYHYDIDWYRQTLHILIEKKQVFHQFSSFTIFICIPLSFCNIYSTESHSKDRRWLIFISFSALWHFFFLLFWSEHLLSSWAKRKDKQRTDMLVSSGNIVVSKENRTFIEIQLGISICLPHRLFFHLSFKVSNSDFL